MRAVLLRRIRRPLRDSPTPSPSPRRPSSIDLRNSLKEFYHTGTGASAKLGELKNGSAEMVEVDRDLALVINTSALPLHIPGSIMDLAENYALEHHVRSLPDPSDGEPRGSRNISL